VRLRDALAPILIVALAGGCASMSRKFTFLRPDVTRKEFTRTAPEYSVKQDGRRSGTLAARERIALAEQSLNAGRLDDAQREATAALKLDPKSADAHTLLAVVAAQRGQSAQAGGHYTKAVELAPGRGSVLNNYGVWLCANGRTAEALAWFDRALADPTYGTPIATRANAGACAVDAGQAVRAERDLRLVLAEDPDNAIALAAMARNEFRAGRYFEARAFSQRRLAAAPATPEILRLASQIEQKLGDNRAAERYMQELAAQSSVTPVSSGETGEQ
jgi:type IV pilus assembly protein PilF